MYRTLPVTCQFANKFVLSHSHTWYKASASCKHMITPHLPLTASKCESSLHGDTQSFHYAAVCFFFSQVLLTISSIILEYHRGTHQGTEGYCIMACMCLIYGCENIHWIVTLGVFLCIIYMGLWIICGLCEHFPLPSWRFSAPGRGFKSLSDSSLYAP